MKLTTMFGEISRSLFQKPATENYPFEKKDSPARLHGMITYEAKKCTGCNLCNKDCPANAIEIVTIDRAAKRFIMQYRIDRCAYCSQCVVSCKFNSIQMSNEKWERAAISKDDFSVTYGREEDIAAYLAREVKPSLEK